MRSCHSARRKINNRWNREKTDRYSVKLLPVCFWQFYPDSILFVPCAYVMLKVKIYEELVQYR